MTVNVHLNADLPTVNDVPTLRVMHYITFMEYCRLSQLDIDSTTQRLNESGITFGTPGVNSFVTVRTLEATLDLRLSWCLPAALQDVFVCLP